MEPTKKIAVYMDHLVASVFEYADTAKEVKAITEEINDNERESTLQKRETIDDEQDLQLKYYKDISDAILDYPQVILFGPTTSKTELKTILSQDKRFSNVDVVVKVTDKLTHNEQVDFINDYFYINA